MKKQWICLLLCLVLLPCAAFAQADGGDALYRARFGDKWGYIDQKGATVLEPQWTYCESFRGDYAFASLSTKDDDDSFKDGVIDKTGRWVVEPKYSIDTGYDGMLYGGSETGVMWLMDESGKMGFFDIPSGCFSGMIIDGNIRPWVGTGRLLPYTQDGLYGYVDRTTGEVAIPCQYEYEPDSFEGDYGRVLLDDEGTEFMLVNEYGDPYIPPEGTEVYGYAFGDGLVSVKDVATGLYGYADETSNLVIPAQFEDASDFGEGVASVKQNGLWGHIKTDGSFACEPKYDCARGYAFHGGVAVAYPKDDSSVVLDLQGNELFRMEKAYVSAFGDGDIAMFSAADEEDIAIVGFVTRTGDVILQPDSGYTFNYNYTDGFLDVYPDGYQVMLKGDKAGFLDDKGNEAIPFVYEDASNFENGLARVYDENEKMMYIDHSGAIVWQEP